MRKILIVAALSSFALVAGCGGSNQSNTSASNTTDTSATTGTGDTGSTNIEEMGPEGGSNVTTTPGNGADAAPVGSSDNGNVAPGDANPNNPRPGGTTAPGNSQ